MVIIAGPCVIESEDCVMQIAGALKDISTRIGHEIIFKASFDKANRSSHLSYRGLGVDRGLDILNNVRKEYNVKTLTDIHVPQQAALASKSVDILQIPAFLSRQTDMLSAAAYTDCIVNVKKAQFMSAEDMTNVVNKLKHYSAKEIWLTERGTTFGYNRLVVDYTGMLVMQKTGCPVIFDATHSVQRPGGMGTSSGGNREFVEPLAKAAAAIGVDGFFFETHPNPDKALSDGPNMVPLEEFEGMLKRVLSKS